MYILRVIVMSFLIFPSYRNLQLTGVYNLLSAIINSLIYESVNKKCSCRVVVGRYHFDEY